MKFIFLYLLCFSQQQRTQQSITSLLDSSFFLTYINDDYMEHLRALLTDIMRAVSLERCFVVITDDTYYPLYDEYFFRRTPHLWTHYFIHVAVDEDLLAPHYQTVRVLHNIQQQNCDLHIITLLDGVQVKRFLRFVEKQRIVNLQQKFVLLHDPRLIEADMRYIWSNMLATLFLKRTLKNQFLISTVAYPNILSGLVVTKNLVKWSKGSALRNAKLFPDKISNLQGVSLPIVVFEHVPMVIAGKENDTFAGVEIEIVQVLGVAMNFKPHFYTTHDAERERWGRELINGSYTGLLGEMTNRSARIGIGNVHTYELYASIMELSRPHTFECLTFLTPESSQDNTWRTLIQPFSGSMWTGVLLSLFIVGSVFYAISCLHAFLLHRQSTFACNIFSRIRRGPTKHSSLPLEPRIFRDPKFRRYLNRLPAHSRRNVDLFDDYSNCLLLTYSMLMYVALPRMPRTWSLRVLTGWYWLYCILIAVTYRASLTAILANPAARITIDTLGGLVKSGITAATSVQENKQFFDAAFDEVARDIGVKMEVVDDIESVTDRIARGEYVYYDNEFFLRQLRAKGVQRREEQQASEVVLHIMRECVVNMPVALALEKNSPLKQHVNKYLQRLIEGGFITKWLKDATENLPSEEQAPQEALMDMRKIWSSFVALSIGYFLGICAIAGENLHFKYVVRRHPLYNVYNKNLYYNYMRRYPRT